MEQAIVDSHQPAARVGTVVMHAHGQTGYPIAQFLGQVEIERQIFLASRFRLFADSGRNPFSGFHHFSWRAARNQCRWCTQRAALRRNRSGVFRQGSLGLGGRSWNKILQNGCRLGRPGLIEGRRCLARPVHRRGRRKGCGFNPAVKPPTTDQNQRQDAGHKPGRPTPCPTRGQQECPFAHLLLRRVILQPLLLRFLECFEDKGHQLAPSGERCGPAGLRAVLRWIRVIGPRTPSGVRPLLSWKRLKATRSEPSRRTS